MQFGVFIRSGSEWQLVETYWNRSDADREATYLRDMLGLVAIVFQSTATA